MIGVEDLKYIPFKVNKEEAKEIVKQGLRGKRIDCEPLVATYIPYWLVSCSVTEESEVTAKQVITVESILFEHHTEESYKVKERLQMEFRSIPYKAAKTRAADRVAQIEPFDMTACMAIEKVDLADIEVGNYELDQKQVLEGLESDLIMSVEAFLRERFKAYEEVAIQMAPLEMNQVVLSRLLVPVWHITYTYRNKSYTIWINGQTGCMAGEKPKRMSDLFLFKHKKIKPPRTLNYLDRQSIITLRHTEEHLGCKVSILPK